MGSTTLTVSISHTDDGGRFHRINVTMNMSCTIRQLVQQACLALQLTSSPDSTECLDYAVKHGRVQLDNLTLLRLSGLTQGAKLELIRLRGVAVDKVTVAVQTEAGRATLQVLAHSTLLSLLRILCDNPTVPGSVALLKMQDGRVLEPALLVMGQEYFGLERLAKTSLVGIGITGGNCLMRLSYRPGAFASMEEAMQYQQREVGCQVPATKAKASPCEAAFPGLSAPPANASSQSAGMATSGLIVPRETPPPGPSLVDRRVVLIAPLRRSHCEGPLSVAPDLPEGVYNVDESDFRRYYAAAQARTRALLEAPLVSRVKLREQQERELVAKHPDTRIRFRFPDQYMLEATFASVESATALYAFLEGEAMTESQRPSIRLSLSLGPPPKPIRRDDSSPLHRLDLTPAAIVNVAISQDGRDNCHLPTRELLREGLADNSRERIDMAAPLAPTVAPTTTFSSASTAASAPSGASRKPAWLKLSK